MDFQLLDCRTGRKAIYKTYLRICEENDGLHFRFIAECASSFCPYSGYNENHYEGDVCEVFIGVGPNPQTYYEVEATPNNDIFLAQITYQGKRDNGAPLFTGKMIPMDQCFVRSKVQKAYGGYIAEIIIDKEKVFQSGDNLYFNAYRIETDGGQRDKHLFALNPTMQPCFHLPEHFIELPLQP